MTMTTRTPGEVVDRIDAGYVPWGGIVADLIDLDDERRQRAPPCGECGGTGPVPPPDREATWRDVGIDTWLGLDDDDPEAGWTVDPDKDDDE